MPAAARAQIEPFVPAIVDAIHRAFSLATASTFSFGIAGALVAVAVVLLLREGPARATEARRDPSVETHARVSAEAGE